MTAPPDVSSLTLAKHIRRRLIGSIRRECIDHIVVFGEHHQRHVLLLQQSEPSFSQAYHGEIGREATAPQWLSVLFAVSTLETD